MGMHLSPGWDPRCPRHPIHGDPTPANNQELISAEDNEMPENASLESETSVSDVVERLEDLSRTLRALVTGRQWNRVGGDRARSWMERVVDALTAIHDLQAENERLREAISYIWQTAANVFLISVEGEAALNDICERCDQILTGEQK